MKGYPVSIFSEAPPKSVIAAITASLTPRAMETITKEIGISTNQIKQIQKAHNADQSRQHFEILNTFLYGSNGMELFDKLVTLTDALIYVGHEDLLMKLFQRV